ncbi:TrkA C-terminal domain-containing protein [Emergencia timonensis]|uniref:TrkA C-terminal domain-containing protein n=1 Tax=Emergencia timonensis TaxID=1776384 RepID=UPI003993103A
MSADTFPQYIRIAYFLASRIAEGDFPIGKRLSGRSKLSSEYQVSPETMRRALQILADMKVVEVKGQSGVYVLSTDNARRCAENLEEQLDRREKAAKLRHLLEEHDETGRRILEVCTEVLESETFSTVAEQRLPNYQVRISEDSDKIGRSLAFLQFWQATGATIVAIRRGYNTMISPGPHAELYGGDYVIFVGAPDVVDKVKAFLNPEDC